MRKKDSLLLVRLKGIIYIKDAVALVILCFGSRWISTLLYRGVCCEGTSFWLAKGAALGELKAHVEQQ